MNICQAIRLAKLEFILANRLQSAERLDKVLQVIERALKKKDWEVINDPNAIDD